LIKAQKKHSLQLKLLLKCLSGFKKYWWAKKLPKNEKVLMGKYVGEHCQQ